MESYTKCPKNRLVLGTSADHASLYGHEPEAVGGNSDADLASVSETPIDPDIGLWAEYTPGPEIPPVLESEYATFQTASVLEQLQARLAQLDQAVAQGQLELQAAVDAQAQFAAQREGLEAQIQAATDTS